MPKTPKQKAIRLITHIILLFGAIVMLFPFIWTISTSLKQLPEVFKFPPSFVGARLAFENYLNISKRFDFMKYFTNSLKVSAWVVFFQLFTSAMAGYVFARLKFPGRDKIFVLYLATMMIPLQVTIIPNFLQMRMYGLVNTLWSLMIPAMVSAFGTFLMRQFFITVPQELDDAARIDGCTPFGTFIRVMLPMARTSLATLGIFCFMGTWNDYFTPLVFLNQQSKYTLTIGLASTRGTYATDWPVLMAAAWLSVLPVVIAFLFAQDAFIKGEMLAGVKE